VIDPNIHFAVIVRPARALMTLFVGLAVVALVVCIVGLWIVMELAEFGSWLLHLVFTTPLLTATALVGGVLVVAGGLWLCRVAYRFLMTL
jgi:hypothetical protein